MEIKDTAENVVYKETRYNGVSETKYRVNCIDTKLDELFPDAVNGLTAGETYTFTVDLYLADGTTHRVIREDTKQPFFTYTHPAA